MNSNWSSCVWSKRSCHQQCLACGFRNSPRNPSIATDRGDALRPNSGRLLIKSHSKVYGKSPLWCRADFSRFSVWQSFDWSSFFGGERRQGDTTATICSMWPSLFSIRAVIHGMVLLITVHNTFGENSVCVPLRCGGWGRVSGRHTAGSGGEGPSAGRRNGWLDWE